MRDLISSGLLQNLPWGLLVVWVVGLGRHDRHPVLVFREVLVWEIPCTHKQLINRFVHFSYRRNTHTLYFTIPSAASHAPNGYCNVRYGIRVKGTIAGRGRYPESKIETSTPNPNRRRSYQPDSV